jgi:hypothetical protein|tara:strand:+ start:468 stop:587 length:120 start_codon:yes stop_codon:yes gene_type:complete
VTVVYAFDAIKQNSIKEELSACRTILRIIDFLVAEEFLA